MTSRPLDGIHVVTIALNLPGPAAARRLVGLGASISKVEPPSGDPMAAYHPEWYATMSAGQEVRRIDLKTGAGRGALGALLQSADVLLTSSRVSALKRLGLDWESVHREHPGLSHVAITGYPGAQSDRTGHDLTYIAAEGLLAPPAMPRTLMADLAGAERAVSAVLALLVLRERGGGPGYMEVSLAEVAISRNRCVLGSPGRERCLAAASRDMRSIKPRTGGSRSRRSSRISFEPWSRRRA